MAIIEAIGRVTEIQETFQKLAGKPATTDAAGFADALARASSSVDASGDGTTGVDIVEQAKKYLGVPYVYGGEDETGMDCSGLVQRVLADLGIDAPRRASEQQTMGTPVASLAEAQPGDLIVTRNADHIVIYAGDGMIVHAPYEGRTVSYQKNYLTDADIQTIRRVTPQAAAPVAVAQRSSAAMPGTVDAAAVTALLGGAGSVGGATASGGGMTDLIGALQRSFLSGRAS